MHNSGIPNKTKPTPADDPEDKGSFLDRIKSDFSRITAGNIDDPKSEAYKKYGAGRNTVKADVPVPAAPVEKPKPQVAASPPAKPRPTERALTDPMYSDTGSKTGMGAAGTKYDTVRRNASEPRPADALDLPPLPAMTKFPETESAKNKPRIVSKKELEDSGFDNLRDYLNAKQGLKRRKEKNPTPKLIDPSNIRSGRQESEESLIAPKLIDPSNIRSGRQESEESLLKNRTKGMKSGGSVSSASSRADGIAQRGKTRGKMR